MNWKKKITMSLIAAFVFVSGGSQSLLKLAASTSSDSNAGADGRLGHGSGSGATCESST